MTMIYPCYECPVRWHDWGGYTFDECLNCEAIKAYNIQAEALKNSSDTVVTYSPTEICNLEKDIEVYLERAKNNDCPALVVEYVRLIAKVVPLNHSLKAIIRQTKDLAFLLALLSQFDFKRELKGIDIKPFIDSGLKSEDMNVVDKALKCVENWENKELTEHVIDYSQPYRAQWQGWIIDYYEGIVKEKEYYD